MSESRLRELGKVKRAWFGLCADRGFVTFSLDFDFGGSGQSFCNIILTWPGRDDTASAALDAFVSILGVFGVTRFEEIAGRYCYALRAEPFGTIQGIEAPKVDGGKSWTLNEWRERWFPAKREGE